MKCESGTFTAQLVKRKQAFEIRYYRRLLNILEKVHVTNEEASKKVPAVTEEYDEHFSLMKKRKVIFSKKLKLYD